MRRTLRLLASVKPVARYHDPGAPTGLTGLYTHNSPRSTLLYLYSSTLDKLKTIPESSLYRQSVEALTKHRMALVEAAKPPGYEEWHKKAQEVIKTHPEWFDVKSQGTVDGVRASQVHRDGRTFVVRNTLTPVDERYEEWDGELDEGGEKEGIYSQEERNDLDLIFKRQALEGEAKIEFEDEPQLTAAQIEEVENRIGAGLIEEVVQVAEGELQLVDTMLEAKPWESLDEKPAEGQWVYFERKP